MGSVVGLDIGTYTIKAIELKKTGKTFRVVRAAMIPNEVGRVLPVDPAEREKLMALVKKLFAEFHFPTTNVRVGLPESMVSTKIVTMPLLSDAELASAVVWQAEQYIPIPAQNLQLEYQVLYRPDKKNVSEQMRVLLVGMVKQTLVQYSTMLLECGLELTGMEANMLGLYRAVGLERNLPTTLVVHFGASTTEMFVVHNGELAFVYAYPNGGTVLSRALERALGLDPSQAEAYKRTYGLDPQLEGKVRGALQPVLPSLSPRCKSIAVLFWLTARRANKTCFAIWWIGSIPNVPTIAESLPLEITLFSPFSTLTIKKRR